VLRAKLVAGATRSAHHHGNVELTARHVEHLGGAVHNLVKRQHGEIEGHHLHDRPQAGHGRAHAEAGKSQLRDGGVQHPHGPEFIQHAFADLVGTVVKAHFLAHQHDGFVAAHLLAHRLVQGFSISQN
jgi:hypothetical protein